MRGAVTNTPSKSDPGFGSWPVTIGHKGFAISYSPANKGECRRSAERWLAVARKAALANWVETNVVGKPLSF